MSLTSSSVLKVALLGWAAAIAFVGCNCTPPNPGPDAGPNPEKPAISFASLPPGALQCSDDADPNTPGDQFDFTIVLENGADCTTVTISNSRNQTTATGTFDASGNATVRVTLVGLDNSGAENPLTATCTTSKGTKLTKAEVVTDACPPTSPGGSYTCAMTAPADASTLTSSPTAVSVTVTGDNQLSTTQQSFLQTAQVNVAAAPDTAGVTATSSQIVLTGGNGTGQLPLPSDTGATLACTVVDPNGVLSGATPSSPSIHVDINIGGLIVTSPNPDGSSNFTGSSLAGVTAPLAGSVASTVAVVSFDAVCVDNANPGATNEVTGSSTTGEVTLTDNGDGTKSFAASMTGLALPDCTVTVTADGTSQTITFTVTSNTPLFAITLSPALNAAGFYNASNLDSASNTVKATANITITNGASTTGLHGVVEVIAADNSIVTTVDGNANIATALSEALSFDPSDEEHLRLRVFASDGTNNGVNFDVPIGIDTLPPTIAIGFPAEGQNLTAVFDVSNAPGFQCPISATVSGIADGAQLDITDDDSPGAPLGTCTVSSGTCTGTMLVPDGAHAIHIDIADAALNGATSGIVHFTSDGNKPIVQSIVVAKDTNNDGVINIIENGGASPNGINSDVVVTFAGSPNNIEDGQQVSINGHSALVSGNTVTIPAVPLSQGSNSLTVNATDLAGNPVDSNGASTTLVVDTIAPVVTIDDPTDAVLNGADDVNANAQGLQVDILVQTDQPANTSVDLFDGSTLLGTQTTDDQGRAFFLAQSLQEGQRDLTAVVSDAAGNSSTSASYSPVVDTTPPVLAINVPTNNQALGSGNDKDGNPNNGIQLDVVVHTDTAAMLVTVHSDVEGDLGTGTTDASGNVTITVTFLASSAQHLTARGSDAAGNLGTSPAITVNVDTGLYLVSFESPILRNGVLAITPADDSSAVVPGVQVVVTAGIVNPDATTTATLLLNGTVLQTGVALGAGDTFTFLPVTLTNGQQGTFEVSVVDANNKTGTTGAKNFVVDVDVPTVSFVTPAGPSATFNAASESGANAGQPGLQTTITVSVTNYQAGTITVVRDGATQIGTTTDAALGSTATNENVAINDAVESNAQSWVATCTDQVGNAGSATLTAKVDVTPPGTPSLSTQVVSVRRGQVAVSFTEPGDDGSGGGNVASCVTIASRQAINQTNFATLAALPSTSGNGGTLNNDGGAVAPGTQRTINAAALAFDNSWNFAALCTDDVGNTSFATAVVAQTSFATKETDSSHNEADVGGGSAIADGFGGAAYGRGDFDGDGADDVVVTAFNEGDNCATGFCDGAVHIYRGGVAGLPAQPTLTVKGPIAAGNFGTSAAIADIDGDGTPDLIVTGYDTDFTENRVYVLYGTGNASLVGAPIALTTPFAVAGTPDLDVVQPVGDVDGDGTDDLIFMSSFRGPEALLVRGSSTRFAAGDIFANTQTTRIQLSAGTPGATVFNTTATSIGRLDADAFGDFVLSTDSGTGNNQLWVVHGRAAASWTATVDLGTAAPSIACPGDQCGVFALTAGDVNGDQKTDLVVQAAGTFRVHLVSGTTVPSTPSYQIVVSGLRLPSPGRGSIGLIGDVNGDGNADFAAPLINGGVSSVAVFFGDARTADRSTADILYPFSFGVADSTSTPACGNVDGDGLNIDEICFVTAHGDGTGLVGVRQ